MLQPGILSGAAGAARPAPPDLEIAGLRFRVEAPADLEVVLHDPRYAPFLGSRRDPAAIEVPAQLRLDAPPDTACLPLAFDSGVAWRAYRDGADLLFDYRLPDTGERLWTARLAGGRPEVVVHCGRALLGSGPAAGTLYSPLSYPLDQLLLMCLLPLRGGLLVHSAGVRRGERAVVCPGHSGAGKSTLSRLLQGRSDLVRISDDRMVLRRAGTSFEAWGTPWAGTERIAENEGAPLAALAFLHQSERTELRPIGPAEGLSQLLPVGSVPWFDLERATACLAFCDALLAGVPLYELHFRRHEEVGEVLDALF